MRDESLMAKESLRAKEPRIRGESLVPETGTISQGAGEPGSRRAYSPLRTDTTSTLKTACQKSVTPSNST